MRAFRNSWSLIVLVGLVALPASAENAGLRRVGSVAGAPVTRLMPIDARTLLADDGSIYDVTDPAAPRRAGVSEAQGTDLRVIGGIGYLAVGRSGLAILDLNDPRHPVRLGGYRTGGDARGVDVVGGLAGVAAADGGLRLLDVANPQRIDQLGAYPGSLAESLEAHGLLFRGPLAYVAAGSATLEVLRIDVPASIRRVGGAKSDLDARHIAWLGNRVLVAGESGGLLAVDVADPTHPSPLGAYAGPADRPFVCRGIAVSGNLVYVAADSAGVLILDWSDLRSPRLAGVYRPATPVVGVTVNAGRVFACLGDAGFSVLEPTTGSIAPPEISVQPRSQTLPLGSTVRFEVEVSPVDGASYQWFRDDVAIPGATTRVWSIAAVTPADSGNYRVAVVNESGTATSDAARLIVVQRPRIYSQPVGGVYAEGAVVLLHVGAEAEADLRYQWYHDGVAVPGATAPDLTLPAVTLEQAGTYAASVADLAGEVISSSAVVAVRGKVSLRQVGRWPSAPDGEYAVRIRVDGRFLYLANGSAGLQVFDIAEPSRPIRIGGYPSAGYTHGLWLTESRLYLADGEFGGLRVLDVSNPGTPVLLGGFRTGAPVTDVVVVDDLAYVASGAKGLVIVDVAHPADMGVVGRFADTYDATSLAVDGKWAWVADGPGGLLLFSVANPAKPVPVSRHLKPDFGEYSVRNVRLAGSLAYVSCTYEGLYVGDLSDPTNPVWVAYQAGYTLGTRIEGNHAFVGRYDDGLTVLDVTTPRRPVVVANFDTPGEVNDVGVSGRFVFVADGKNGLLVLESNLASVGGPALLSIERVTGMVGLRIRYPGDRPAVLERSADLRAWQPVQTNLPAAGSAGSEFLVEPASDFRGVFYRVVQ